jgi:hypothetical protein
MAELGADPDLQGAGVRVMRNYVTRLNLVDLAHAIPLLDVIILVCDTSSANWSEQRRAKAPAIASVLYGVVAIMTVDLAVQPDRLRYTGAILGVLLIGLAMALTRLFVRVVTKEAEIGSHLPLKEAGALLREALLVMLFPGATAVMIAVGASTTTRWPILLDLILYFRFWQFS